MPEKETGPTATGWQDGVLVEDWIHAEIGRHEPGWGRAYPRWCSVIRQRDLHTGAEIGVAFGGHTEAILKNTEVRKLYSVDMFRHDPDYVDPLNFPQERFDELFEFVRSRIAKFGARCEVVRLESGAAAAVVPDGLDFVYLDANHSFEGVSRDLGLWAAKVHDGGIVGGHDYGHPDFPGVRAAVDRFCRRFAWAIHEEGEGVWWTAKATPRVTFVVPAFNCSPTIEQTLRSIAYDNLAEADELVVIDDASTDDTARILDDVRRGNAAVRILTHRVNKGTAAAARNTGIEAASNELIFCLDSDNVLESRSIHSLASHLFRTGADAAAFGEIRFFDARIVDVTHKWVFKDSITLADALAGNHWPGPSGNYLFTRESWRRAGRYHEPSLENPTLDSWIFGVRQLGTGSKMVTLAGTWYSHRYGHESHYVRNWKKGSQSLAGLIGLIPLLDLLDERDVAYIFGAKGRYTWYEKLNERPLRLRRGERGQNGTVSHGASDRRERGLGLLHSRLKKVKARLRRS